jgi:hypothetical protein
MNQINWFIDQKKCEVNENDQNLTLKIFLPINTIKEIVFTMKLKIKNTEENVQELFKQIQYLKNEDQRNKRLIKLLFEKINILEKKINNNKSNSSEDELTKIIETKETIIENPPSNTKTFKLNSNITKNEYRITFENQTEKLYLFAIQSETIPEKKYETEITLDEIKNNKFFSMCEDFNSFMNQINWFIDQKKCEVNENDQNLTLKIYLPINTIKEIIFTMKLKIKNTEENIQELFKQIQTLKNEDQRNKRLIKLLLEKINILEKKINNNNNKKEKIEGLNSKEIKEICKWIDNINYKNIKLELIFSKIKHKGNAKKFHKLCDHIKGTIIIYETENNNKFGGFTSMSWNDYSGEKKDKYSFLFNLNTFKKYEQKIEGNGAIYCSKSGPIFGNSNVFDIGIENESLDNGFIRVNNYINNISDLNSEEKFKIKDIKVYKILN